MREDQCHVGKFRRIHSRCVIWATDARCAVRHAGHSRPIPASYPHRKMIDMTATQQPGKPITRWTRTIRRLQHFNQVLAGI